MIHPCGALEYVLSVHCTLTATTSTTIYTRAIVLV